jgi:lipoprotein-releasing system ATP-binding protein
VGDRDAVPVVELRKVCKSYDVGRPNEVAVLFDIDLVLRRGEFCAVVGPSGSGKSTLLNIVGLLDRPTSGELAIDGHETASLDDAALTHLRVGTVSASSSSFTICSAGSLRSRT